MIVSFGDRATEDLYHNRPTAGRRFPQSRRSGVGQARYAQRLRGGPRLRSPPGNRLEVLKAT